VIAVTIDGRRLETAEGRTILQLAREHGIPIPTLCYHEAMEPFAACRLCVVEVDMPKGRQLVASCAYPCSDGLVVHTQTEAVQRSRRMTVELLMASSDHVPLIRQLADQLGLGQPRFRLAADDCVLCGLCVRACREIVGVGAISLVNRGIDKRVSPPFGLASNACIGCGTCVLVCPTGAITLEDINGGAASVHRHGSEFHAETCRVCGYHVQGPESADVVQLLAGGQCDEAKELAR
jgi:bidirectional [NiFe] hydrogenase diaphorase subunit